MQPSDQLRAAADRIRDLAAAAQPGPWKAVDQFVLAAVPLGTRILFEESNEDREWWPSGNTAWVAALSPAVAPHATELLQALAADDLEAAKRAAVGLARELVQEDQK